MCDSIQSMGFSIVLLGRKLPDSNDIIDRNYKIRRFKLPFTKGAFFYASLNIRFFFYLLFHKADVLVANDLDTLLQVWLKIEKWIFPKLKYVITVNKSIADIYSAKYGNSISIVRNLPNKLNKFEAITKKELQIEHIDKYIIMQGAGINMDRGAEELVEAMLYVNNTKLLIVGNGDIIPKLKVEVNSSNLKDKVIFIEKQNHKRLMSYTYHAELGLSLDKDSNMNYRFSLPNKIFDYINMGIPILVSDLVELRNIVNNYNVGRVLKQHSPKEIAKQINEMIEQDCKTMLKANLDKASNELNWETQEAVIKDIYSKFL
ncbi:MAG: hypothetical protein B6I18_01065 [Bacteroidetes bacterium 4572_112]|nr:MAG: hypothetical protein B6I18_01065 [Bacteroidetes bacterium 4572_112]